MEKNRKVKAFFTIDPDLDKYFEKHIEENGKKCIFYEIMIIFVKINIENGHKRNSIRS